LSWTGSRRRGRPNDGKPNPTLARLLHRLENTLKRVIQNALVHKESQGTCSSPNLVVEKTKTIVQTRTVVFPRSPPLALSANAFIVLAVFAGFSVSSVSSPFLTCPHRSTTFLCIFQISRCQTNS